MRSRVIPGSSVTMERRRPIKRLKSVDLPTFGRPTIAMSGNEEDMESFSLPFRKITHPMMWDLNCLTLIYSSIDEDRKFENPAIGTNCRRPAKRDSAQPQKLKRKRRGSAVYAASKSAFKKTNSRYSNAIVLFFGR